MQGEVTARSGPIPGHAKLRSLNTPMWRALAGLGGYNTSWAKHVLQHVLDEGYYKESTLFATVFFGANDAVHPE